MKIKYIPAILLILAIVGYGWWFGKFEKQTNTSRTIMVTMRGFDTSDLLSGHYLYLTPDWNKTNCAQFEENTCPTELFSHSYRYHLPELASMNIERKLIKNAKPHIEIEFAIFGKAKPLVKNLYINGQKWRDWFIQFSK